MMKRHKRPNPFLMGAGLAFNLGSLFRPAPSYHPSFCYPVTGVVERKNGGPPKLVKREMAGITTIYLTRTASESLTRLTRDGRSTSDIIREALALEEVFQRAVAEGSTVVIRSNSGQPECKIVRE